jgi:hypothetical protein
MAAAEEDNFHDGMLLSADDHTHCPESLRYAFCVYKESGDVVLLVNEAKLTRKDRATEKTTHPVYFDGKWIPPPMPDGYGIDHEKIEYYTITSGGKRHLGSGHRPLPPAIPQSNKLLSKVRFWIELRSSNYFTDIPEGFFTISQVKARDDAFNAMFGLADIPRLLKTKVANQNSDWDVHYQEMINNAYPCLDIRSYWDSVNHALPISRELEVSFPFEGISTFYCAAFKHLYKDIEVLLRFVYGKYFDDAGQLCDDEDFDENM